MSKKELFDHLEKTDEGKLIAAKARKIFDDYDAEAATKRLRAESLESALKAAGIEDTSDSLKIIEQIKSKTTQAAGAQSDETKATIDTLMKKLQGIESDLQKERGEKDKVIGEKRRSDLTAAFGVDLAKHFGTTVGELLTKKYLDEGAFTNDEAGKPILKTTDAVYTKEQAIEHLKIQHKDLLRETGHQGPGPARGGKEGGGGLDLGKASTSDLLSEGLK